MLKNDKSLLGFKARHELKYEISYGEYIALRTRLTAFMHHDKNAGSDGKYLINSLYFDNFYDKALREKLNGISRRDKFRIRYYNNDTSFIKLEKKSKRNNLGKKTSSIITVDECRKILQNDTDWMKKDERSLIREFCDVLQTQLMQPKCIVSYTREPFVYAPGNVRITFDMDIRSSLYHTDIFDSAFPQIEVLPGRMILEVKYDQYLPDIIQMLLQSGIPRVQAYSKYAAARKYE